MFNKRNNKLRGTSAFTGDMTTHYVDGGGKTEIMGGDIPLEGPKPSAGEMKVARKAFDLPKAEVYDSGGAVPKLPADQKKFYSVHLNEEGKPMSNNTSRKRALGKVNPPGRPPIMDEGGQTKQAGVVNEAKNLWNQTVGLFTPDKSIAPALHATAQNENEYLNPVVVPTMTEQPGDVINPHAKYGDRRGEKRPPELSRPGLPTMDQGGPHGPMELADAGPSDSGMRDPIDRRIKPVSMNAPDINDGQHYPAVLMKGERVLTPAQNAEWMKDQHGFGKMPSMREEMPMAGLRLSDGTKIPMQNGQANAPTYDCGGPAKMVYDDGGPSPMSAPQPSAIQDAIDQKALHSAANDDITGLGMAAVTQNQYDKRMNQPAMEMARNAAPSMIERPQASGATDHPGPAGIPASPAPKDQQSPYDNFRGPSMTRASIEPFDIPTLAPTEEVKSPAQGGLLNLRPSPISMMSPSAVASTPRMKKEAAASELKQQEAQLSNVIANSQDPMEVDQARNQLARLKEAHPIFHGVPRMLGDILVGPAILQGIPGTAANLEAQEAGSREQAEQIAGTQYKEAEAGKTAAEAARMKAPGYGWKPAQGEQFTHYAADGTPDSQLWINDNTGQSEWRGIPRMGVQSGQPALQLPEAGTAPQGTAQGPGYFGSKQEHGVPLSPTVISDFNRRAADLYQQTHPGQKVDPAYQLPPNATDKDLAEYQKGLDQLDTWANRLAQQAQTQADKDRAYALQQQLAGLREDMQNAKPAIGTDKNGQRIAGSYGELKAAGFTNIQDNATAANDRSYYNLSQMVTRTKQYLRDLHAASDQDFDLINRINADIEPGLGASQFGAGGSLRGGWFNAMLNSADYKKLSPAGKRLANDYSQLGESAIAYLTSVSHITGMRGGTAMIDRISRAWMTPQKDYAGNLDATTKFIQTLMAAEHTTPQQYLTDSPINWEGLESAREQEKK